uniref:Bifunctional inhibitor/plant lipid transfer protein/seed storage helical domain-containing protein n=1 Tax=Aegilops tauschii TaxID=37682 RepID=N1QUZ7_AEGTA
MRSLISVSAAALVLAAVLAAAPWLAGGQDECGATPPDQEALKLVPCVAAGKDPDSKPSDRCCAAVKEIGERSPACLCAVLLSKIVRRVGVKPEVAITMRCALADRPIGYKCGDYTMPSLQLKD